MNKFFINLISFLLVAIYSYGDTHFIYVELSAKSTSMDRTKQKVKKLIAQKSNDDLLAYFSKRNEPIKCETKKEIKQAFNQLKYMANPSVPDGFSEVKRINQFLISKDLLKGIKQEPRKLDEEVHFHFFLHPEQVANYKQVKNIVKQTLLTNRLYNKKGLFSKVVVNIYLDCNRVKAKVCRNELTQLSTQYSQYDFKDY